MTEQRKMLDVITPTRLKGKDLEQICIVSTENREDIELARYGTQSIRGPKGDLIELQSLPDFDGVLPGGREVNFDAKVCSQSSFAMNKYQESKSRQRQLRHMYRRSKMGSICFFLIHWNERELALRTDPARTVAFPIHPDMYFWERFEAAEERSINRQHCDDYGVDVEWTLPPRCRKPRLKLVEAIVEVGKLVDKYQLFTEG